MTELPKMKEGSLAHACYHLNPPNELIDMLLERKADPLKCKTWNLKPTSYKKQIALALKHLIADLQDK